MQVKTDIQKVRADESPVKMKIKRAFQETESASEDNGDKTAVIHFSSEEQL